MQGSWVVYDGWLADSAACFLAGLKTQPAFRRTVAVGPAEYGFG